MNSRVWTISALRTILNGYNNASVQVVTHPKISVKSRMIYCNIVSVFYTVKIINESKLFYLSFLHYQISNSSIFIYKNRPRISISVLLMINRQRVFLDSFKSIKN
ncbi:hypothetical protein RF11_14209 [Thelohanellus kitauei]|uniref:Uncharacterized protein n=1 Tax=Thelohanellus kitauei TaxID=669202 RepID=A0A0C2ILL6_THEKT|nr:hypothetical protein RF11_14209 [Thelohanellus kitauei]